MRIEICGGIASGKTTLANLLHKTLGFNQINEEHTANPFWERYMADPKQFCFEAEIVFLLQHYHQIKFTAQQNSLSSICDFSLFQDKAYATIGLDGAKLEAFFHVYRSCLTEITPVDFLIYLKCSEPVLLQRIAKRARKEEKPVSIDFLKSLNSKILVEITQVADQIKIIEVDSEKINFAESKKDQDDIIKFIGTHLKL